MLRARINVVRRGASAILRTGHDMGVVGLRAAVSQVPTLRLCFIGSSYCADVPELQSAGAMTVHSTLPITQLLLTLTRRLRTTPLASLAASTPAAPFAAPRLAPTPALSAAAAVSRVATLGRRRPEAAGRVWARLWSVQPLALPRGARGLASQAAADASVAAPAAPVRACCASRAAATPAVAPTPILRDSPGPSGPDAPADAASVASAAPSAAAPSFGAAEASMFATALCALNCTVLPLVLALAPLTTFLHSATVYFVVPVGAFALASSYKTHRRPEIAALGTVGLSGLALSSNVVDIHHLLPCEWHHPLSLASCGVLLGAQWWGRVAAKAAATKAAAAAAGPGAPGAPGAAEGKSCCATK